MRRITPEYKEINKARDTIYREHDKRLTALRKKIDRDYAFFGIDERDRKAKIMLFILLCVLGAQLIGLTYIIVKILMSLRGAA